MVLLFYSLTYSLTSIYDSGGKRMEYACRTFENKSRFLFLLDEFYLNRVKTFLFPNAMPTGDNSNKRKISVAIIILEDEFEDVVLAC